MRRAITVLALIALPAFGAETRTSEATTSGGGGAAGGISNGGVALTANTVPKATAASTLANSTITDDGTTVTVNGATAFKATVPQNGSVGIINTVATLTPNGTGNPTGLRLVWTGSGSGVGGPQGFVNFMAAGYTGASATILNYFENDSAGTNATFITGGNSAVQGSAVGATAGHNYGTSMVTNGSTTFNVPFIGIANGSSAGANVGAMLLATNGTGTKTGAFIGIGATKPTSVTTALQIDNYAVVAPIMVAQDNGTSRYIIQDDASVWASQSTKTLTESAATTFVRLSVASGARTGGTLFYCINAADASDHQERCGQAPFAVVNKAGTETCAVGTAADVVAVSAGTLTVAFTADTAVANGCDLQANAVSSLTQTTLDMSYFVQLTGIAASAVTPQ